MRQFDRFTIPVVVDAPELSDLPLVPEDVSAGGFRLVTPKRPPAGSRFACSLQISGEAFDECQVEIIWVHENDTDPPSWTAGLSIRSLDGSRDHLAGILSKVNDELT